MKVIEVRNAHQALPEGIRMLQLEGKKRSSRYGDVLVMESPVTTLYTHPHERVVWWSERDANPFFHLFESLWMLAGRNDVEFLKQFAKRMETFSDDGKTFHGAYGNRWRNWFNEDQLKIIIEILRKNPDDRRCVLQMWDPDTDLGKTGKDFPCNTNAYFWINTHGRLDMTVCNRSNDIIWGAYGANAVHFSVLQEYVAVGVGVPMGQYWQMSNNYHAYVDVFKPLETLGDRTRNPYTKVNHRDPYEMGVGTMPTPIVDTELKKWNEDLAMWLENPAKVGLSSKFFLRTATPMYHAWLAHKQKDYKAAIEIMEQATSGDWKLAAIHWLERRKEKYDAKS